MAMYGIPEPRQKPQQQQPRYRSLLQQPAAPQVPGELSARPAPAGARGAMFGNAMTSLSPPQQPGTGPRAPTAPVSQAVGDRITGAMKQPPAPTMEPPNPTQAIAGPPTPPSTFIPPVPTAKGDDEVAHKMPGRGQMPPGQREGGIAPRPGVQGPRVGQPPAPPALPPVEPTRATPQLPAIDPGAPGFDANLRSDVYTPGEDPALASAQKATQSALGNIMGADPYSEAAAAGEGRYRKLFGSAKEGDRASAYAAAQDSALEGLSGPSRTELAKQALADFEAQGEKALQGRFRKVGQESAKFGRLGMGAVNAELGSIQGDFERDRLQKMNELASSVAEGDIGDRFRRVDATSGLRRGEAGIDAGLRDENFSRERSALDYAGRDADRDISDRYNQFGAAGTLEDRLFREGQSNRDEFRAERGRQDEVEQRSLDNRIRERALSNSEREQRLSRALALAKIGGTVPNLDELLGG